MAQNVTILLLKLENICMNKYFSKVAISKYIKTYIWKKMEKDNVTAYSLTAKN